MNIDDNEQITDPKVWAYLVLSRDNFQCAKCHATKEEKTIKAHHKNKKGTGKGNDHRLSNGEALCGSCHLEVHGWTVKGKAAHSYSGYTNRGCRCDICKQAAHDYYQSRKTW